MTKVGVITQARMTSTRLPGKVLMTAGGTTMLGHHVRRLRDADLAVYVATTTNDTDDSVVAMADSLGVDSFRGSEHDVLARFADTVRAFDIDVVVRVTADCPLIDGHLIRAAVDEFVTADRRRLFISNTLVRSYPRGLDFEVFAAADLLRADAEASSPHEREHVTPYLYEALADELEFRSVTRSEDASGYRITLDTPEDLQVIRTLIEHHGADGLSAEQIIDVLAQHPEIAEINRAIEQKKLGE